MVVEPAFHITIVVVMGSSTSGVTAFIRHVSELPPQTLPDPNPSETLKPLDYGRLSVDASHVIYVYGISEANPLSAWTFLFDRDDPVGVIALVDSVRPSSFEIARTLIRNIDEDIPLLVAANKQDLPDAWELDAIQVALKLSAAIPIMRCSAKTGEGVHEAVLELVDRLFTRDDEDDQVEADDDDLDDTEEYASAWEDPIGGD